MDLRHAAAVCDGVAEGMHRTNIHAGVVIAALVGLAAGAEFDIMSFLVSRYFALNRYGIIYSCLDALFKIGAGIGGPLFALSFDFSGSYALVLNCSAASLIGVALLLLILGPYAAGVTREDLAAD
jgi:MFS family permease